MACADHNETSCEQCGKPIDLGARGVLSLRHAGPGDEEGLALLYASLTPADLLKRFFTAGPPGRHFLESWVDVASKGGRCLLAELVGTDGHRHVIAEAGFAPLTDGDVELGITVAPGHRGWIGPWLLDVLLSHAAAAGIANMQALVKTGNRPMLDVIRHRGCVIFDEEDWDTMRVTMATDGHTPSWPPDSPRPRILIESPRSKPDAARRLRYLGGTRLVCGGFANAKSHCPLHDGHPCPLIDGADAVVIDRSKSDAEIADALAKVIAKVHPDAMVTVLDPSGPHGLPVRLPPLDLGLGPNAETEAAPTSRTDTASKADAAEDEGP